MKNTLILTTLFLLQTASFSSVFANNTFFEQGMSLGNLQGGKSSNIEVVTHGGYGIFTKSILASFSSPIVNSGGGGGFVNSNNDASNNAHLRLLQHFTKFYMLQVNIEISKYHLSSTCHT
jgi:hypothetical protein